MSIGQELGGRVWLGCPENARDLLHTTTTPEGGKLGTRSKLPICVAEYKGHTHGGTSSWIWFFNKEPQPFMTSTNLDTNGSES